MYWVLSSRKLLLFYKVLFLLVLMVQNSIYYLIYLNNHFWHFQIGYIWCNILVTLVVHELHLQAVLILEFFFQFVYKFTHQLISAQTGWSESLWKMVQQILVVIIEFKNVESLTVLFTITLFYFYRKTKL